MLLGATLNSAAFIESEGYYFLDENNVEYQDSVLTLRIASRDTIQYSSCMVRVEVNPFNGMKIIGINPDFSIQDYIGPQTVFVSGNRDTTWEKNRAYLEYNYPKLNPGARIACFSVKTNPSKTIKPMGEYKNIFLLKVKINPRQIVEGDIDITILIYDVTDSFGQPIMVKTNYGDQIKYQQEIVGSITLKNNGKLVKLIQSDR